MPYAHLPSAPNPMSRNGNQPRDRWLGIGLAFTAWLSLALLIASCGADQKPRSAASDQLVDSDAAMPPFYRIEGGQGAMLLLMGTIHLGPPEGWRFSPAILDGLDRANRFVLEIDIREATEEAVSSLAAEMVVIEPPNTLIDLVSPETAKVLEEKDADLAMMGMPENARRWMKPWFIAMSLIESAATRSGFSTSTPAESAILEALGTRPLIGLETFEEQMEMLDGLSARDQDLMLRDTLSRIDTAVDDIRSLVQAWRRGDEDRLEELARDGVDELPELEAFYDVLLGDRNRRWLLIFQSFLDSPRYADETVFVGVGALHLVGQDGLVDLLREEGYVVDKIDHSEIQRAKSP